MPDILPDSQDSPYPPQAKRVVLRDIAKRANVHITTAARAIKNDSRVKRDTLLRIQRIAKELGYSPDPMLKALSSYRSSIKAPSFQGTIAWVSNFDTPEAWGKLEAYRLYRQGAVEALAEHGYQLENHWLGAPDLNQRRMAQILQSRGIRGILVCPMAEHDARLSFPWERFASVSFGYSLVNPSLNLVTTSHYYNMQTCLRRLYQMGYRRPGWVIWDEISKRVAEQWTAAYRTPAIPTDWDRPIPNLRLKCWPALAPKENRDAVLNWFKTYRPDAILVVDRHILDWLQEAGVRVPGDVAYISPSLQESNAGLSGVVEPSLEIGHAAGECLVGMLIRGEYGIPRIPRRILLDGIWQQGLTMRKEICETQLGVG